MIDELRPVWKQFEETYVALRDSLAAVPDDALAWRPGRQAVSVAHIVQHVASANSHYASRMDGVERERGGEYEDEPSRAWLVERLNESERRVREAFERVTSDTLRRHCAHEWRPLNEEPPVRGPLDVLWFALQTVRHSAYHLGQVNLYLLLRDPSSERSG